MVTKIIKMRGLKKRASLLKAVLGEQGSPEETEKEVEPPSLIIKAYPGARTVGEAQFRRYRKDESKVDYLQNIWDQEDGSW